MRVAGVFLILNDGCCHSRQAGSDSLCVHNCSFWTAAPTVAGGWSGACTLYLHPRRHSASACSAKKKKKTTLGQHQTGFCPYSNHIHASYWPGVRYVSLFLWIQKNLLVTRNEGQKCVEWYRKASTRVEHLKRVDNPLVVRAQQRADVFARRIAQPLRHTGPAPLLTHHLETSFVRHNLEHTGLTNHSSYAIRKVYTPPPPHWCHQIKQHVPSTGQRDQGCAFRCVGFLRRMPGSPRTWQYGPNN